MEIEHTYSVNSSFPETLNLEEIKNVAEKFKPLIPKRPRPNSLTDYILENMLIFGTCILREDRRFLDDQWCPIKSGVAVSSLIMTRICFDLWMTRIFTKEGFEDEL